MNDQTKARVQQYALASTYEISCLTNMANVAREMGEKGTARRRRGRSSAAGR